MYPTVGSLASPRSGLRRGASVLLLLISLTLSLCGSSSLPYLHMSINLPLLRIRI